MTYPANDGLVWNIILFGLLFFVLVPSADELESAQRKTALFRFLLHARFLLSFPIAFFLPLWLGIAVAVVMIVIQFTTTKKTR